jgi:hypothetical protein
MEQFIVKATDINNSDIDFVDVNGTVYIVYSWGNQQGRCVAWACWVERLLALCTTSCFHL